MFSSDRLFLGHRKFMDTLFQLDAMLKGMALSSGTFVSSVMMILRCPGMLAWNMSVCVCVFGIGRTSK